MALVASLAACGFSLNPGSSIDATPGDATSGDADADASDALEMPVARSTRGAVALEQAAIQWERKGDAGLAKDLRETASRIRRALAWTGGDE